MLKLYTPSDIEAAVKLLQQCSEKVYDLLQTRTLMIKLEGSFLLSSFLRSSFCLVSPAQLPMLSLLCLCRFVGSSSCFLFFFLLLCFFSLGAHSVLCAGLEYMNDDPSAVDVLYLKVHETDDLKRLNAVCGTILADVTCTAFCVLG